MSSDRVTELLELNTRLETERRKYKLLYEASRAGLRDVLDMAVLARLGAADPHMAKMMLQDATAVDDIITRNEMLERDAWTASTGAVRKFMLEASQLTDKPAFVERWMSIFGAILTE